MGPVSREMRRPSFGPQAAVEGDAKRGGRGVAAAGQTAPGARSRNAEGRKKWVRAGVGGRHEAARTWGGRGAESGGGRRPGARRKTAASGGVQGSKSDGEGSGRCLGPALEVGAKRRGCTAGKGGVRRRPGAQERRRGQRAMGWGLRPALAGGAGMRREAAASGGVRAPGSGTKDSWRGRGARARRLERRSGRGRRWRAARARGGKRRHMAVSRAPGAAKRVAGDGAIQAEACAGGRREAARARGGKRRCEAGYSDPRGSAGGIGRWARACATCLERRSARGRCWRAAGSGAGARREAAASGGVQGSEERRQGGGPTGEESRKVLQPPFRRQLALEGGGHQSSGRKRAGATRCSMRLKGPERGEGMQDGDWEAWAERLGPQPSLEGSRKRREAGSIGAKRAVSQLIPSQHDQPSKRSPPAQIWPDSTAGGQSSFNLLGRGHRNSGLQLNSKRALKKITAKYYKFTGDIYVGLT
ncbi:hypothetical protein B0H10DRAFT_1960812 [Mycena sp. CBHHK59/15]|nr:hypothetical protein B0H10DRAFT_1960812 [Mycena sp. CBHHK59/15]